MVTISAYHDSTLTNRTVEALRIADSHDGRDRILGGDFIYEGYAYRDMGQVLLPQTE